jgi:hypothetical protein
VAACSTLAESKAATTSVGFRSLTRLASQRSRRSPFQCGGLAPGRAPQILSSSRARTTTRYAGSPVSTGHARLVVQTGSVALPTRRSPAQLTNSSINRRNLAESALGQEWLPPGISTSLALLISANEHA